MSSEAPHIAERILRSTSLGILSILLLLGGIDFIYNIRVPLWILKNYSSSLLLTVGFVSLLCGLTSLVLGIIFGAIEEYRKALKSGVAFLLFVGLGNLIIQSLTNNLLKAYNLYGISPLLEPLGDILLILAGIIGIKKTAKVDDRNLKPVILVLALTILPMVIMAVRNTMTSMSHYGIFSEFFLQIIAIGNNNLAYAPFGASLAFFSLLLLIIGLSIAQKKGGLSVSTSVKCLLNLAVMVALLGIFIWSGVRAPRIITTLLVGILGLGPYVTWILTPLLIIMGVDFVLLVAAVYQAFLIHYQIQAPTEAPTLEETIEEITISEEKPTKKEEEEELEFEELEFEL